GERRAVAGGERAARTAVEDGPERRELLNARVGAHVVVGGEAAEGGDEVAVEAVLPRGRGLAVARRGELVLLAPADLPFLGHDLAVFAHREARAQLGHA